MRLSALRDHPRFWALVAIFIGLIFGNIVFQFYTGFSTLNLVTGTRNTNNAIIAIESLDQLNAQPILRLPAGASLLNASYNVAQNGPYTVYMWLFQFSNSSIHPLPIIEPVYQYWYVPTPLNPSMYAVYVRFHYFTRLVYGGWTLVNQTRIVVSFSPTYYIPTIGSGLIATLLKPVNATVLTNYPIVLDPTLPHSSFPTTTPQYTPDPWLTISSPETVQNGLLFGTLAGLPAGFLSYGVILVTIHPASPTHRKRFKKSTLAAIVAAAEAAEREG